MPCIDCPFCGEPAKMNAARTGYYCPTCGAREGPQQKKRRRAAVKAPDDVKGGA